MRALRWVALLEATSFLALLIASVVKRTDGGEMGVTILGPVHGALFLAYVGLAIWVRGQEGWSIPTLIWVLIGAVVPFGGYVVDWWLAKQMRMASSA